MSLDNNKKGLRELLAARAKGSAPKDASGSQLLPTLPPPPLSSINPFVLANHKKRKKDKKVAEKGKWSPWMRGFLPSCLRQPRAKGGPLLSRARRPSP